jgi:hypothetical protein
VSDATITADLPETPKIQAYLLPQFSFYFIFLIDNFTETAHLLFDQLLYFFIGIDACLSQDILAKSRPDSIDIL